MFFFLEISYNQPKLCSSAKWDPNSNTFANATIVGRQPRTVFINRNNTVYIVNQENSSIHIWFNDSISPSKTIYVDAVNPNSIFVTMNNDIYVDNGKLNNRVEKWTSNGNSMIPIMIVYSSCYGLFVDINDTLYCSIYEQNKVIKRSLNDNTNVLITAAGTDKAGSDANQLYGPDGIFVDTNFDLYVADFNNNRIQLFRSGTSNGITVAGKESLNFTIELRLPTSIVLDADKYLFIVDSSNDRIVRSGPNGFQCLIGCSDQDSAVSSQLIYPETLSFDSYGNLFVVDWGRDRIKKFILLTNSCGKRKRV